ncbi:hypothetical protein PFISCL1PPCAC_12434 [Pristionchus fissidentatus]|uniref:BZIP domain-containing protein n=1 Tax=Pristionchus fissidentatus TaxID=1538716 RepID=A0AAV5VR10_9BILA|nr:hypothetical protein PFISCL1PPCAC_12434 [Pristionchus fissidentatus]
MSSSRLQLLQPLGVVVDAPESVAAYTASCAPPTVDIATQQPAYSTKIVATQATIGQHRSTTTTTLHSAASTASAAAARLAASTASTTTTVITSYSSSNSNSRNSNVRQQTKQPHSSTPLSTVSLTGPRQPSPPNTILPTALRESTHSDTAEYSRKKHSVNCHREVRMVWPTDLTPYDWPESQWNGQPIPIDEIDHVFDTPDYRNPDPFPQQQQYPIPEQNQVVGWSREEQATMDRLIEDAMGEDEERALEEFDLDRLDELLGEVEMENENEPLTEFFPMLGSSSALMAPLADLPPSTSQPLQYHEMAAPSVYHQTTMTQHTTTSYDQGVMGQAGGCGGEWLRMGGVDGRIDRSPTFMDTGCDLNQYLNDWYDEPSTSRSSPDYDIYPAQHISPPLPIPSSSSASMMTSSASSATATRATRTTRTTTTTVRYAPYKKAPPTPAPSKRPQPVFRPEGFGTPAIGEDVGEYRKRRDKNNVSSARSRAKKAEALKEMKVEAVQLEKKNIELKAVLDSLEREVSYYKELMMTALAK